MIKFNDVSFTLNDSSIISNVSFQIQKGDFISIIGSNGAGKSTLLKLCNGLLKPTSGDVLVFDKNTKKEKTSSFAKHIGFLFQNPDRQICCNTIKEEISFSMEKINLPKEEIQKRTEETLRNSDFNPDEDPFNLSRGQRQRLCLSCLITLSPDILILDEPTTGLDYKECMELMNKIKDLNNKGTTVIMVCHDMEIVLDFAKKVLVMNSGKMIAQGETRKILSDTSILEQARLLPPQIVQTSMELGKEFNEVFTVSEMISKIKTLRSTK